MISAETACWDRERGLLLAALPSSLVPKIQSANEIFILVILTSVGIVKMSSAN
jgi:hypothetical protein